MADGPFDLLISFGIPGPIFQIKAIQFGTNMGFIMLLDTSSGFTRDSNLEPFLVKPAAGSAIIRWLFLQLDDDDFDASLALLY